MKLPPRIGLHSWEILLGNIGAAHHFEYRPVGDIVNTATRIEGVNKYLGTRILISREVRSKIHGFLTRDVGVFLLAGKSRPVPVYELVARIEESTPRQRDYCAVVAEGVDGCRRQSLVDGARAFHETLEI